ncbi:MAG: HDOD domain-containing protein [bacterium]
MTEQERSENNFPLKNINDSLLILLFSQRDKIRSILTAGLLQGDYRVIEADSLYVAGVKANQYLPDLVIIDLTKDNIKDFLFITRLQKSVRTKSVLILLSVTSEVSKVLGKVINVVSRKNENSTESVDNSIQILEYPFHFTDLLKKIDAILFKKKKDLNQKRKVTSAQNELIGERLFDARIPLDKKFRDIECTLQKQWAFPFTVIKALDIAESESSCCKELGKCIETDAAAASSVLRVSNTVYYAKRGNQISNVSEAVVRIGFHETRNLLSCLALIDLSKDSCKKYGFTRREFWMHSLATAIIAEKLCLCCGNNRPELAFISGLIHDLGKIPLDNNFTFVLSRLLEETTNRVVPFCDVEQYMLGFTHAELGHYLTSRWNFPSTIKLPVLYHHESGKILSTKNQSDRILQESIYVANIFAKALNFGHSCDEIIREIPGQMLEELGIKNGPKDDFAESVFKSLKLFCKYLNMPGSDIIMTMPETSRKEHDVVVVYGPQIQFHPIVMALESNGYRVKSTDIFSQQILGQARIVIFIPDKGSPLDITIHGEEEDSSKAPFLKIFLLEGMDFNKSTKEFAKSDVILMNRQRLDLRLVLHTFDQYLGNVIVPQRKSADDFEDESAGSTG